MFYLMIWRNNSKLAFYRSSVLSLRFSVQFTNANRSLWIAYNSFRLSSTSFCQDKWL